MIYEIPDTYVRMYDYVSGTYIGGAGHSLLPVFRELQNATHILPRPKMSRCLLIKHFTWKNPNWHWCWHFHTTHLYPPSSPTTMPHHCAYNLSLAWSSYTENMICRQTTREHEARKEISWSSLKQLPLKVASLNKTYIIQKVEKKNSFDMSEMPIRLNSLSNVSVYKFFIKF